MTTEDNIRAFLSDPSRRKKITINGIEVDAKIPAGNLAKFMAKKRGLPAVQIERLVEELKSIGFGIVPNATFHQPVEPPTPWGDTLPMFPEAPEPSETGSIGVYLQEEAPKDSGNEPEAPEDNRTPMERLYDDRANMSTLEFNQHLQEMREAEEREEHMEWINMPAEVTGREISQLMGMYKKKKMKVALFVRLRVFAPVIDVKHSWQCYLELADASGKLYKEYKHKASPAFCESIFGNKAWKETNMGNGLSFFTKPIGNPVIEPAVKVKKEKKPKPVIKTVWDMIDENPDHNPLMNL